MTHTPDIIRPSREVIAALQGIGAATVAGTLGHMGIRNPHMQGPVSQNRGKAVVGPVLTLQMMPKREDLYDEGEYADPEKQLHRHVLYHVQEGDVVVVDARGDMTSGIFGDMMLTYFTGRGGAGVIIDGCIRDYPKAQRLGIGLFLKGTTPNFHTQTNLIPWAVNVPVAVCGVLVMPGDIMVADDDGAVVVPAALAPDLVKKASEHAEWEDFSRQRLFEGGDLRKYYPLRADGRAEYEEWRKTHPIEHK